MSKKYYQCQRANTPVAGILFTPQDNLGGVLWGIYATENEEEQVKLDAEVAGLKRGVFILTEAEFATLEKKINPSATQTAFQPSPILPVSLAGENKPAAAVNPRAAEAAPIVRTASGVAPVVVNGPVEGALPEAAAPSLAQALSVGDTSAPSSTPAPAPAPASPPPSPAPAPAPEPPAPAPRKRGSSLGG